MAKASVPRVTDTENISVLLGSHEIKALIADLQETRWTGRPGYPLRAMVGMALVKSLYALPTWTRTVRLVGEHGALRRVLGAAPSVDACYRFTRKLREHGDLLAFCVDSVVAGLREQLPDVGAIVAIDGSDLPAYANGQRYVSKGGKLRERFSDRDATWGHRSAISTRKGGGYYGYKVHAAVCVATGIPVAWMVETASRSEVPLVPTLLDVLASRGISPGVAVCNSEQTVRHSSQQIACVVEAKRLSVVDSGMSLGSTERV